MPLSWYAPLPLASMLPAMSICAHRTLGSSSPSAGSTPSTKDLRNSAAVQQPAREPPVCRQRTSVWRPSKGGSEWRWEPVVGIEVMAACKVKWQPHSVMAKVQYGSRERSMRTTAYNAVPRVLIIAVAHHARRPEGSGHPQSQFVTIRCSLSNGAIGRIGRHTDVGGITQQRRTKLSTHVDQICRPLIYLRSILLVERHPPEAVVLPQTSSVQFAPKRV